MRIPLIEPSNSRYLYINHANNRVHLLVPFTAGLHVSTDNTCKSNLELKAFFEGGAVLELDSYKATLEFHMSLLEESDVLYLAKKERLAQINIYIEALVEMWTSYQNEVDRILEKDSNLYGIQLRPETQDPLSNVVNPVFTINRKNDAQGAPLSPLYNQMQRLFAELVLKKPDPRKSLINSVLERLPQGATFDDIRGLLKSQCAKQFNIKIDVDNWINEGIKTPVNKEQIDKFMGFAEDTSAKDYIDAVLGICAPELWQMIPGSPFYLGIYNNKEHQAESLSLMTQFYLGVLNVYCRSKGFSDKNFGEVLDNSSSLSEELVNVVAHSLSIGENVESHIAAFFNQHQNEFGLSRELDSLDKEAIIQKFETTYRIVTATKENPHMDDFMFLDTEAQGENAIFIAHKGLICTDASNIIPTTPKNQAYFAEIRQESHLHPNMAIPQGEPAITVEIEPADLRNKLSDVQWKRLPKDVRALPAFKVCELLDYVGKGRQDEAYSVLESSRDKQNLLRTPGRLTDYSGRSFHCTAYEYAYWAKDTHMQRMLEGHMDEETKAFLLERIDAIERYGLVYQQHGIAYQNAHYDMSFVLKNLNADEFHQLQKMIGKRSAKIQQATVENYKNVSFTATEYEWLKKILKKYRPKGIFSFFCSSPAKSLSTKLQFDFHSLITELESYTATYGKLSYHQRVEAWMKVGKAQRDVPAHIAHEYCRPGSWADPLSLFSGETLPRSLRFIDYATEVEFWFPLSSAFSGLGFDFAMARWDGGRALSHCEGHEIYVPTHAVGDLAAVRHLDEVRTADLEQSRENLSRSDSQLAFALT